MFSFRRPVLAAAAAAGLGALTASAAAAAPAPYIAPFTHVGSIASTVPTNGDVNPYGIAVVTTSTGDLVAGDVLVSNFNDKANLQGTGTTIVEVSPGGQVRPFAHLDSPALAARLGGIGLTTALAVLPHGWVVVGDLPTRNGTAATAKAGGLIILNSRGAVAGTITGPLVDGPWDLTARSHGDTSELFVTNVLAGTVAAGGRVVDRGSVVRVTLTTPAVTAGTPQVTAETIVGSGFAEQSNSAALVLGPTGVGLAPDGTLYVADTLANRIAAIPDATTRSTSAGTGTTLTKGDALDAPLGLAAAPDGDVLTVNGGNGQLVDTIPAGNQASTRTLDSSGSPPGAGALFGLAVAPGGDGVYFVDDATNTINLLGLATTAGYATGGHR